MIFFTYLQDSITYRIQGDPEDQEFFYVEPLTGILSLKKTFMDTSLPSFTVSVLVQAILNK